MTGREEKKRLCLDRYRREYIARPESVVRRELAGGGRHLQTEREELDQGVPEMKENGQRLVGAWSEMEVVGGGC
ncbi:hypothetical protein RYX36_028708 [Vicia faba]